MQAALLHSRFCALANKLRVADPDRADTHAVRIGRDPDDRWIQVMFKGDKAQFQRLREALVLTAIVARADCTAWRHELTETCRLVIPPGISLDDAPLSPRVVFALDSMRDPSECAWSHLQPLVGDGGYGETFEDDFARISASRGKLRPIPTQLVVEAASHWTLEQQIEMLRGLVDTIEHMQQIEDVYRHDVSSADSCRVPVFTLDSIRLELGNLTSFSAHMLDELRLLLETGVSVRSLVLPCAPGSLSSDACYSDHAVAWSQLSMAICSDQVHVQRFALSVPHASSPFLTALLSALRHSRNLSSLTIDVQREFRKRDSVWPWLAFSLFSVVSTSSIEELHLENFELREDLEAFARIMTSVDPIRELWNATVGASEPQRTPTQNGSILVRPGADFFVLGGGNDRVPATIPCESVGTLVHDDPTSPMLDVLLPGFGFGSIAHECVVFVNAEAPTPSPPRHRLRTLVLDFHTPSLAIDDDNDQQAERRHESDARAIQLVRRIGPDLSSLGLYAPFLNATSVEPILQSCPHLTSVRLAAMALESLAFLREAYDRGSCRVASLDLYSVNMEPPALASFLQLLVVPNSAVQRTLKRLRFDEMWVYDLPLSIVNLLRKILNDPASLEHLHVVLNSPTQQQELASAPAATVPLPLPLANRLALLSALRCQAVNSAAHSLDPFVLTRVFQWAEAPTRRTFVFEIGVD